MACKSKLRGACAMFLPFVLIHPLSTHSQCLWDGGAGDHQWITPANWTGDTLPGPFSDVLLDNSLVPSNYTVTLPAGAETVTVKSLVVMPSAGHTIEVLLPSGNMAAPAFTAQGPGYGLMIHAGGIFRNASGITSGQSLLIADSLLVNNGGKYVHQTRASHAGSIAQILSRRPGTETGIVEFDVPGTTGYTVSASGRVYGALVFSANAAGGARTYSSSGSNNLTVRGDFRLNAGVNYNLNLDANLVVEGDLVHAGSIFNVSSGGDHTILKTKKGLLVSGNITETAGGIPVIELCGVAPQQVNVSGSISNDVSLRMNNPAGAILQSPLALPYRLELLQGKITSSHSNLLTLLPGCSVLADSLSNNSFVDGPLRKQGLLATSNFLFPVGKDLSMRWLALKNATGDFTVEYFKSNPGLLSNILGTGIHHISGMEYWMVQAGSSTSPSAKPELSFADPNSGGVTDLATLRVAQLSNNTWYNRGNTAVTGSAGASGSVTANYLDDFGNGTSWFTLAASDGAANPLPLGLLSFSAALHRNTVSLAWKYTGDAGACFELLRADHRGSYKTIARKYAENYRTSYTYVDKEPRAGTWFYRIRIDEANGGITLSEVIPVVLSSSDIKLLRVSAVPGNSQITVQAFAGKPQRLKWIISNIAGSVVKSFERPLVKGINTFRIDISNLSSGLYTIRGVDLMKSINTLRFVKY